MNVQDTVALVTGASEGIGREIVLQLVERGVHCIAFSRDASTKPFHNELVHEYDGDVTNLDNVRGLFDWIRSTFGRLDILVNNAGIWQKTAQLEDIDDTVIDSVVRTNLLGPISMTKYGLPLLRQASEALIVNVASRSGITAQPGQSVYSASKWGLRGFSDVLRQDLAESNVHVIAVYQGGTKTHLFEKTGEEFSTDGFIEPSDLADVIVRAITSPPHMFQPELRVDKL